MIARRPPRAPTTTAVVHAGLARIDAMPLHSIGPTLDVRARRRAQLGVRGAGAARSWPRACLSALTSRRRCIY